MSNEPRLRTFRQFSQRHEAFPESSLRWTRFNQETNGFARAFVTVGRRVLIDEAEFFRTIDRLNGRAPEDSPAGVTVGRGEAARGSAEQNDGRRQ